MVVVVVVGGTVVVVVGATVVVVVGGTVVVVVGGHVVDVVVCHAIMREGTFQLSGLAEGTPSMTMFDTVALVPTGR